MIIPLPVFSTVILVALLVVVVAPVILLALLFRDWRKGRLW